MASPRIVAILSGNLPEDTVQYPPEDWSPAWGQELSRILDTRTEEQRRALGLLGTWTTRFANIKTVTTTYSIDEEDYVVLADATGGAFSVTLPDALNSEGHEYIVKKIDAVANVTITPASGNIDGAGSVVLATQYHFRRLVSDGTNWWVIGS